ncbi:MAG TPA: hypothetical protein VK622_01330 [Puia sp.]|nr:hypothetical protein [Puia sp.]
MNVFEMAESANSKEDFINFLDALLESFNNDKDDWENPELGRFLEAMERFLVSSTDQSLHKVDFTPSWSLFARIMYVASKYE